MSEEQQEFVQRCADNIVFDIRYGNVPVRIKRSVHMREKRFLVVLMMVLLTISSVFANGTKEVALVVYGSTEEEHVKATVDAFVAKTGYNVVYQRLSAGEVQTKISEEVKAGGKPSGDIFFGYV